MQVHISSQHIKIHHNVYSHAENKLKAVVSKYFQQAVSANINFVQNNHRITCNITLHDGVRNHITIFSEYTAHDIYESFDVTLAKLEKQLRKYKSKIKNHQHDIKDYFVDQEVIKATKYIFNPNLYQMALEDELEEEVAASENNPVIIEEKPIDINTLTISQAVMKLELENLPTLMFKNAASSRINVIYQRSDGNIAWIDSTTKL